ncbi:XRE family transcriptional regulator [Actinomadura darangshiensis]|uniref:XRE family transcriptional regulator n=1 Tax=Actinomadura darangshiensis TaxID=705336 RepID=A0A4R4ZSF4_9ACTN|nr:helix-turn-helix transcriptional regulator [Actinomadura darangshiensis]TDD61963.1 XRE family transcriptional regulator [Actinomadura darangshiensis]
MANRTSPTVRRRRLAREMRQLRRTTKKSREDAARYAGIAPATLSRIEAATHAPKPADILALCKFYEVDEEKTETLVTLARQSRQRGWWQKYGDVLLKGFDVYVGLEEEADELRSYQPELITGLLQTPDYMRAVVLADLEVPDEAELERRISVRMQRQENLLNGDGRRQIWAIIHEAALRLQVGGPGVMRGQLEHLHDLSRRNAMTLQVLPFTAGAHPGMQTGFYLLGFAHPADPDIAYIEYRTGGVFLEQADEVAIYVRTFDQLRARATGPDEARLLIERILTGM